MMYSRPLRWLPYFLAKDKGQAHPKNLTLAHGPEEPSITSDMKKSGDAKQLQERKQTSSERR